MLLFSNNLFCNLYRLSSKCLKQQQYFENHYQRWGWKDGCVNTSCNLSRGSCIFMKCCWRLYQSGLKIPTVSRISGLSLPLVCQTSNLYENCQSFFSAPTTDTNVHTNLDRKKGSENSPQYSLSLFPLHWPVVHLFLRTSENQGEPVK